MPEFLWLKGIFTLVLIICLVIILEQPSFSQSGGTQNIIDNIPPVITVPKDSTLEATSINGRNVTYDVVAADQIDGIINANCNRISGSMFPIGSTSIICQATDKNGNKGLGSFEVTIRDSTPPDTTIVGSRAGWIGKINSNSTTISNQANFEIAGSDSVGVRDYECRLDSGKWNRIEHLEVERNVCQYSQLPDGTHIFESRAIDQYGNVDNSPSSFNWTVTSIEEGIQEIINLISSNLTETEKKNFDLPLVESQKLLTNTGDYSNLTICYNMDSFLNEINDLSLHDKLDKSHINQLVISTLSIKDRLTCE